MNRNLTYTLTKVSDDAFGGEHPNYIDEGYTTIGFKTDIIVGESYYFGELRTSIVTEIISDSVKESIFKTQNSTYKLTLKEQKTHFVIDRSKWRNGVNGINSKGQGITKLLNEEGYMCCLGMVCSQLNISDDKLLRKSHPIDLLQDVPYLTGYVSDEIGDTDLAFEAITINDN